MSGWGPNVTPMRRRPRIITGDAHMGAHTPPTWLIDGIVQRGRLYACTSLTGHGKTAVWLTNACMIHAQRMVGHLQVFPGNVLYLAGENPSDLAARMLAVCRHFRIPSLRTPYVLPCAFPMVEEEVEALKQDIASLGVPLALIVGDTAVAYYPGVDENDNVAAAHYARTLRSLTECPGSPAVVFLSHPVKNAPASNLLPRGGGAFLNELDGNLTLWSDSDAETTTLHWQGKIRGPDFAPFSYRMVPVPTGLVDERGRPEVSVVAVPISDEEAGDRNRMALAGQDSVLRALRDHPDWSLAMIARSAGWVDGDDVPQRYLVQRAMKALAADRLVHQPRKGAPWKITDKGRNALSD